MCVHDLVNELVDEPVNVAYISKPCITSYMHIV